MSAEAKGKCDEKFAPVREAFANNLEQGGDVGATFALTIEGETVIDLWGGWKDAAKTEAWEEDTIVNVYSTTKTMAALTMLMLADRGEIDFYAPVAKYWPEFAQNGKEAIELRHVMSHSAGLPGLDEYVTEDELYDHDRIAGLLATQEPWWEPGTASGYHAFTQGFLQNEIVRRATGKTLGALFAEEVAGPLGADFFIGTPPEKDAQVSTIIPPENPDHHCLFGVPDPETLQERVSKCAQADSRWAANEAWRRAELPAANGHGNARSVAQIHTILANGGEAKGKRFLSEEGCRRIFDTQTQGRDLVLGVPLKFGMGFGLNGEETPVGPNPNTCFWQGWGGSIAIIDMDAHMTVAYVMNQMVHMESLEPDPRSGSLLAALFQSFAG